MSNMKKFYVGIKGIIVDPAKGALLLNHSDFWDIPGGRIDDIENIQETLRRELNEELPGVKVLEIGRVLNAHRLPKDIDGDTSLFLVYFAVKAELPEPLVLSDEHESYLWVKTVNDIPSNLESHVVKILKDLLPND